MPHSLKVEHRALTVMICALFFIVPVAFARDAGLADALYGEGDWRGARAEALRVTLSDPDHVTATLIYALASLQLDFDHQASILLLIRHPDLAAPDDPVRAQTRSVRGLIPPAIRQGAEPPPRVRTARVPNPGTALVRFYQTQIGPAIGQRCSMHPSCSTYCMEALRQYGLLAIPLTADRLIRETDHVNHRINPIRVNGQEKYYDPVSDHTFWFRRQR